MHWILSHLWRSWFIVAQHTVPQTPTLADVCCFSLLLRDKIWYSSTAAVKQNALATLTPFPAPVLYITYLSVVREAPVRLRFGGGAVRAVLDFGSGGSSAIRVFLCFSTALSFLSWFFLENGKENHKKKTRIFHAYRTPKIHRKEGENARKNNEFPHRGKTRNSKINKERKDREFNRKGRFRFRFLENGSGGSGSAFAFGKKIQCHAEGGATKGGVSKCEQTQTNADKRRQTQANAEAKTQANASKREQTWTNANKRLHPPLLGFFNTPLCNPLKNGSDGSGFQFWFGSWATLSVVHSTSGSMVHESRTLHCISTHRSSQMSFFLWTLRIFWGYFLPQKVFLFSEVLFEDPPKIPFKTSRKIASRGYFYF